MLEVEPTSQHGPMTTRSGRNSLTLISLCCQCHEIWVGPHWWPIICHSHRLISGKDWTRLLISSVHLSIVTCYRRVGGGCRYRGCCQWTTPLYLLAWV